MPKQPAIVRYHAAGGVVTDEASGKVLLLIRPSRDEVRLPKGHVEPEESPGETALREVTEEAGYSDLEILADLGEQLVVFPLDQKMVQRTERYFLMQVRSHLQEQRPLDDDQQFFPVWVSWEKAITDLTFEVEREWVRRAQKTLSTQP